MVSTSTQTSMTFFEALYGSQYAEISQQGKDGNKGRLNGNLLLSAMAILLVLDIVFSLLLMPGVAGVVEATLEGILGYGSGRSMGRILGLLLLGAFYFVIANTVGSQARFEGYVRNFLALPEEVQKGANRKVLGYFFALLGLLILLLVLSYA